MGSSSCLLRLTSLIFFDGALFHGMMSIHGEGKIMTKILEPSNLMKYAGLLTILSVELTDKLLAERWIDMKIPNRPINLW